MNTGASTASRTANRTATLTAQSALQRLRQLASLPLLWPDDLIEVRACVLLSGEKVIVRRADLSTGRLVLLSFERVNGEVIETEL